MVSTEFIVNLTGAFLNSVPQSRIKILRVPKHKKIWRAQNSKNQDKKFGTTKFWKNWGKKSRNAKFSKKLGNFLKIGALINLGEGDPKSGDP